MSIEISEAVQKKISDKKAADLAYKKYLTEGKLKQLGLNLAPDTLRVRNPFSEKYKNLTVQGFLIRFEPELANELKGLVGG